MHIATVVLSVLLAVEFAFTGLIKILCTATARANAEHLGISLRLSRLIGVAELAAVVGLLAGIAVKPLVIVTSAAVVLLIAGAVGYHLKARDKVTVLLPAALTGLAAIALLVLTVASQYRTVLTDQIRPNYDAGLQGCGATELVRTADADGQPGGPGGATPRSAPKCS